MHKTTKDGLNTITFTEDEWMQITVGYEKVMRLAKYRASDGGDTSSFSPAIDIADSLVVEADALMRVDEWADKTKQVEFDDRIPTEKHN